MQLLAKIDEKPSHYERSKHGVYQTGAFQQDGCSTARL
jgi:hypothetical protein